MLSFAASANNVAFKEGVEAFVAGLQAIATIPLAVTPPGDVLLARNLAIFLSESNEFWEKFAEIDERLLVFRKQLEDLIEELREASDEAKSITARRKELGCVD